MPNSALAELKVLMRESSQLDKTVQLKGAIRNPTGRVFCRESTLVKNLLVLQARFLTRNGVIAVQLANFLRTWLVNHIMETDKKLALPTKQSEAL